MLFDFDVGDQLPLELFECVWVFDSFDLFDGDGLAFELTQVDITSTAASDTFIESEVFELYDDGWVFGDEIFELLEFEAVLDFLHGWGFEFQVNGCKAWREVEVIVLLNCFEHVIDVFGVHSWFAGSFLDGLAEKDVEVWDSCFGLGF